ncbi:MAG: TIGR03620 family F420-dependent LLM class oxidoreductase [Mycobacterium sp.]
MTEHTLGPWGFAVPRGELDTAAAIEDLGYSALWLAGGQLDRLSRLTDVLAATRRAVVASSIIPPGVYGPAAVTQLYVEAESEYPGRLLIGLGAPQQPAAIGALNHYLDQLEEVPQQRRILAAIGPRKLDLARDRFAGAVPILVTPAYTTVAKERLGADRTLAVGLFVVLDEDPAAARETARQPLRFLLGEIRGYQDSARRQGFTDHDITTLSDHLVDALTAWGSPADIAKRTLELRAAGADHVQVSVLHSGSQPGPVEVARQLAPLLA